MHTIKKYFVYAIKSQIGGRIYVGISKNPYKRLGSHNKGETISTKPYRPWTLIYIKLIGTRKEARKEEKRLKSGYGKEFLKSINNDIIETNNLAFRSAIAQR